MCAEAMLAVILALLALNAELTYRKETKDVRRYNTEIRSRQLAAGDGNSCTDPDRLACESFCKQPVSDESAHQKTNEAARKKT